MRPTRDALGLGGGAPACGCFQGLVPPEGQKREMWGDALAEEERHHPDILISFNRVRIDLTTHAIGGLSENDFILAVKIDRIGS